MSNTSNLITSAGLVAAALFATVACQSATIGSGDGRSVTATTQRSLNVKRGESVALKVDIDRQKFAGPVTVSLHELPDGVKSHDMSVESEADTVTFILSASQSANLADNQAVGITIEDAEERTVTMFVSLDVRN